MSELRDERPGPIVEDLPIWLGSSDSRSYSKAVSKKFNENLRFPNDSSQNLKEPQGQDRWRDISQADPRCLAVQQVSVPLLRGTRNPEGTGRLENASD